MRLREPAPLLAEAQDGAETLAELPKGELVEAVGLKEASAELPEWLLVRSPAEEQIEIMSDKPLAYQDGWLSNAPLQPAEYQLGTRVAARVDVNSHPALDLLRQLPWWRGTTLPDWIVASVAELHKGKIGGVVKNGRYLVQRPAGAMPERVATTAALLITPKERAKRTVLAGFIGLVLSGLFGSAIHAWAWMRGERSDSGRVAWPKLVGWMTLITVILTPAAVLPCFGFANSPASTACVVAWINMLLYSDLFND